MRLLMNFDVATIDQNHRKDFGLGKIQQKMRRLQGIWEHYEKAQKRTEGQKDRRNKKRVNLQSNTMDHYLKKAKR